MEFNDVINEFDEVIDSVEQQELYKSKLPHRIVHVLLFDKKKRLLLQQRSKNKSFCPLCWVTSANGHVISGETPRQAAGRECQEELGIRPGFRLWFKDRYDDPRGFFKFLNVYTGELSENYKTDPVEVEKVELLTLKGIEELKQKGEKFHPELEYILNKFLGFN